MNDFLADDLFAEEREAGRTKRKTQYRIKKKRRMSPSEKNKRNRTRRRSDADRKKLNKELRRKTKLDRNFRENKKRYNESWRAKNVKKKPKRPKRTKRKPSRSRRRASIGFSLPFNLEFLYQGIPAYLMSLSEMFDAVNIYVEGETSFVVDLNQFLDNTEWYDEDDFDLFLALIDNSYAVLDEHPDDSWSEYTLDERDPPAKSKIDKQAFNKYNAPELMGQLLAVLNKNGLDDTVKELKSMRVPQIVNSAWNDRE